MVLGYTRGGKGECQGGQYSLMVYLWHSSRPRGQECHKPQLRNYWHSCNGKKPQSLCLSMFPRLEQRKNQVKGAKIPEATMSAIKGAIIQSKGGKPNAGLTAET